MIAFSRYTLALWGILSFLTMAVANGQPATQTAQNIGFAVISLKTAGVETPYLDECPEGVALGNDEIWWRSLSPRDRDRLTDGGQKEPSARRGTATLRGPKGEDVCWNPGVVRDPVMRTVKGLYSVGFNLDGTQTGQATPKTCAHDKFITTDGRVLIDNQMKRLTGCIHGWRSNGYIEMTSDTERRNSSFGIILLHVLGVTDLRNAPDVTVRVFRSADVMPKDAAGNILPFASYRIDGNPRYGATLKGRIKDGILTTEPADVHLPFYGNRVETEFFIRDFRLELKLTENGASGLIGGYHDLDNWWDYVRKMGYLVETAQFSCPALYAAALQLADGHPDSQTGACTSLSVAYSVDAVRAFVNENPRPIILPPSNVDSVFAEDLPPGIKISKLSIGDVLTTTHGATLYIKAVETMPCSETCSSRYVPLRAAWGAKSIGDWTIVESKDARQWSKASHPVFICHDDFTTGDINCNRDGWQPLITKGPPSIPSAFKVVPTEVGPVLADSNGRTLYRFIGNMADFMREICDEDCMAAQWHTVAGDGEHKNLSPAFTIRDEGNSKIWMFKKSPIYTFTGDDGPGEISGHRFGGASVSTKNWFAALTVADAITIEQTQLTPQKD